MIVEQSDLTAFHFLYVLIIPLSENLYLFEFSRKLAEFSNSKLSYYGVSSPILEKLLG